MSKELLVLAILISITSGVFAQNNFPENKTETGIQPDEDLLTAQKQAYRPEKTVKNYSINLCLRISDDANNSIVNSSWSRITVSGKPITINLKANNLQIAAVFIPYYIDEKSVVLLSQGKVMLKPVNNSEGKYYSTVDSLPLKIGEKALFFPLGLLDEKMENISSCVLEIEVQHYDKIDESIEEERVFLETTDQSEQNSSWSGNTKNIKK
jgi:hypothetical protein